jgi:hypothetical protein
VRLTLTRARSNFQYARHEARKVLVLRPEPEDLIDGRVDHYGFLDVNRTAARSESRETSQFDVGRCARHHSNPSRRGKYAGHVTPRGAVAGKRRASRACHEAGGRRPLLLPHLRTRATRRPLPLQCRNIARLVMFVEIVDDVTYASDSFHRADHVRDFVHQDRSAERHHAIHHVDVNRTRVRHGAPYLRAHAFEQHTIVHRFLPHRSAKSRSDTGGTV